MDELSKYLVEYGEALVSEYQALSLLQRRNQAKLGRVRKCLEHMNNVLEDNGYPLVDIEAKETKDGEVS